MLIVYNIEKSMQKSPGLHSTAMRMAKVSFWTEAEEDGVKMIENIGKHKLFRLTESDCPRRIHVYII